MHQRIRTILIRSHRALDQEQIEAENNIDSWYKGQQIQPAALIQVMAAPYAQHNRTDEIGYIDQDGNALAQTIADYSTYAAQHQAGQQSNSCQLQPLYKIRQAVETPLRMKEVLHEPVAALTLPHILLCLPHHRLSFLLRLAGVLIDMPVLQLLIDLPAGIAQLILHLADFLLHPLFIDLEKRLIDILGRLAISILLRRLLLRRLLTPCGGEVRQA